MTVVITVLTEDRVMQASDRRLVWLEPDGTIRRHDDSRNKAVLYANRLVFAYTGLAEIGPYRQQTDLWLAHQLASAPEGGQDAVLEALARATTGRLHHGRMRSIPRAQRGHEFVACGWARFTTTSEPTTFRPYLALVTNLWDAQGNLLRAPADDAVLLWRVLEREEPGYVLVSGQQFAPNVLQTLIADIGAAVNAEHMADVLISHIRRFADRNTAVGRGVLLSSLPRAAIQPAEQGMIVLASGPMADLPTFLSVSPDASDPVQYGPIVVSIRGGIASGFVGGPPGSIPGFPGFP
jgi:hypothetical protein